MKVQNASHRRTQQVHGSRRRTRGNEAPMIIGSRDAARLFSQILTIIRGTKK
jgi:hypothetical protein